MDLIKYLNGSDKLVRRMQQRTRQIIAVGGQSNAVGEQVTTNINTVLRTGIGAAYPNVNLKQQTAQSTTTPITWSTPDQTAALASYSSSVASLVTGAKTNLFGPELSLGRHLDFYHSNFDIAKLAIAGSDLATMWLPTGTYPNGGTSDNLWNQWVAYMQQAESQLGGKVSAFVWIQGEADAGNSTYASNYQTNLTALFNAFRAIWPSVPIIFLQLNNTITATYKSTIRSAQAAVAAATTNCTMINADDMTVDATGHYSANGYAVLGDRIGDAIVTALGLTNPKAWTVDRYSLVGLPQNATEWAAVMSAAGVAKSPGMLWLFDGLASGNVPDAMGAFPGTATGTPGYNVALPGEIGWKANSVKFTNGVAAQFYSTSASLPDPSTTSDAELIYSYVQDVSANANLTVDATSGFSTITVLNTHTWQIGDGANAGAGTTNPYGNMRFWIKMRNKTAGVVNGYTDLEKVTTTPGTVTGQKVMLGATAGNALAQHLMRVGFSGANAEMTDAEWRAIAQTLGWGNTAMGGTAIPW